MIFVIISKHGFTNNSQRHLAFSVTHFEVDFYVVILTYIRYPRCMQEQIKLNYLLSIGYRRGLLSPTSYLIGGLHILSIGVVQLCTQSYCKYLTSQDDRYNIIHNPTQHLSHNITAISLSISISMVYYFKTRCGEYTIYMGKDQVCFILINCCGICVHATHYIRLSHISYYYALTL